VTKCHENQPKGENKIPKIINTSKYTINQPVCVTYQEAPQRIIIGKYTINKSTLEQIFCFINIIYQEDTQRILSNKENSLTIMIIKSINKTYLFFKPIIQNES